MRSLGMHNLSKCADDKDPIGFFRYSSFVLLDVEFINPDRIFTDCDPL